MKKDLDKILQNLRYQFNDNSLLEEALRHSSFVNEQPDDLLKDNERLEFLGDAVLNLVVGHLLMKRYPEIDEGALSKMRSNLVNESKLADISRTLDIGMSISLGKGEVQSNGFNKPSILADTLEALLAAIYLDGGYDKAFIIIQRLFQKHLETLETLTITYDYKSQLQEFAQLHKTQMPRYTIIQEIGPDHDKTFTVKLTIGTTSTEGIGKNKKAAEQDAAKKALEVLYKNDVPHKNKE